MSLHFFKKNPTMETNEVHGVNYTYGVPSIKIMPTLLKET